MGAAVEQTDPLGHVQRFEVDVTGQPFTCWLDGVALLKRTTYNAFGHADFEQAGNDVITTAQYCPMGGLMYHLNAKTPTGHTLQDLHYQYDPVGNIKRIEDLAQPVQWFARQRIQAVSTYTYDTLYQLINATGRESASQTIGPGLPGVEPFGPPDDSRWRNYSQTYTYDSGGNLTRLQHATGTGNTCTRDMVVDPRSNRSLLKDGSPVDFAKGFDANGNQQSLVPGQLMQWSPLNQLQHVTQVQRDEPQHRGDDSETYVYDGGGRRVRKVRRAKSRGTEQVSEVRYLPGLEIRTRTAGEQLHVVIAQAGRNGVRLLHWDYGLRKGMTNDQVRYHLTDHLGSCTLELDQNADLLSQESYYPFGGTAWWAAKNVIQATYKVIRYSAKERDATGLYYYGFRYYAPWLQRWINPDPAGEVDGLNLFRMVRNNPLTFVDVMGLLPWNKKGKNSERKETSAGGDNRPPHTDETYLQALDSSSGHITPYSPDYLTPSAATRGPWKPLQASTLMTWADLAPTQKLVHMLRWEDGQLFSDRADNVFSQWDIFSTSLVDLNNLVSTDEAGEHVRRTGTIGEVGFILKAAPQNIVGVHEKDISFQSMTGMWIDTSTWQRDVSAPYELAEYVKNSDDEDRPVRSDTLMTPGQVLGKTDYRHRYSHNEILVAGRAGLSLYQDFKPTHPIEVESILVMPYDGVSTPKVERLVERLSRLNPHLSVVYH